MHPDASSPTKRWPAESFARLGDLLVEQYGVRIVIVGSAAASPIAEIIVKAMKAPTLDLTGRLTLMQLASLLRRAVLFVSNDSGPVHMACATKTPLIDLFLRDQPGMNAQRWRPLGEKAIVLINKPGEEVLLDKNSRVISGQLGSTTPEQVLEAARGLLGES